MPTSIGFHAAILAILSATAAALDGIVAPSLVTAGQEFQVTFLNANDDAYRVYLAASLASSNGPTCYLTNSTQLSHSLNLTIPPGIGPSADYYSIAIADLTTNQASTYSNRFNLTGATGTYSIYENHLGGSPFWSADDLPCSAYPCARACASASYPDDLTSPAAFATMKRCILACKGVTSAARQTAPAHLSNSASPSAGSGAATTVTQNLALIPLASGGALTAAERTLSASGSVLAEAVIGSETLTLGGAARTISGENVSLATDGVEIGGSTRAAFSGMTATETVTDYEATAASSGTSSGGAAAKTQGFAGAAMVVMGGFAGLAGLM